MSSKYCWKDVKIDAIRIIGTAQNAFLMITVSSFYKRKEGKNRKKNIVIPHLGLPYWQFKLGVILFPSSITHYI